MVTKGKFHCVEKTRIIVLCKITSDFTETFLSCFFKTNKQDINVLNYSFNKYNECNRFSRCS